MWSPLRRYPTRVQPLLLAFLVAGAPAVRAQESGSLRIQVVAAADARPIAGVQVLVKEIGTVGTTDRLGRLEMRGLAAGTVVVEARHLGFAPWSRSVAVRPGEAAEVTVELAVEPIALAAVEISGREANLERRGFYDRMRLGGGTFLTREQIERKQPRYLSDMLRSSGVHLGNGTTGAGPARLRGQQSIVGACPIQYFLDGVVTTGLNIDDIRPQDVAGIEVYRGAASIPATFKRGTATCGVIAVWTRVR